eukprot:scaffold13929_cov16-Prasinocladus_malaysianus.AAC.1
MGVRPTGSVVRHTPHRHEQTSTLPTRQAKVIGTYLTSRPPPHGLQQHHIRTRSASENILQRQSPLSISQWLVVEFQCEMTGIVGL